MQLSPCIIFCRPQVTGDGPSTQAHEARPGIRRKRSLSEVRAESAIASLEVQLNGLMAASKFGECAALKKRIDEMRKAQSELSGLKVQLEEAKVALDFMQCDEIQRKMAGLKVRFNRSSP